MKFPAPLPSIDFHRIQMFSVCISLGLGLGVLETEPRAHTFFSLFILIYFDVQGLFVYLSGDRVSVCSPNDPRTCYVGISMHSYRVLGLWGSALTPNLTFHFETKS